MPRGPSPVPCRRYEDSKLSDAGLQVPGSPRVPRFSRPIHTLIPAWLHLCGPISLDDLHRPRRRDRLLGPLRSSSLAFPPFGRALGAHAMTVVFRHASMVAH